MRKIEMQSESLQRVWGKESEIATIPVVFPVPQLNSIRFVFDFIRFLNRF